MKKKLVYTGWLVLTAYIMLNLFVIILIMLSSFFGKEMVLWTIHVTEPWTLLAALSIAFFSKSSCWNKQWSDEDYARETKKFRDLLKNFFLLRRID